MYKADLGTFYHTPGSCDALPACKCEDSWISPLEGEQCAVAQSGCANPTCDGDPEPWCIVSNSPCAEEVNNDGWAYCAVDFVVPNEIGGPTSAEVCTPDEPCPA